ncbi:FAT4-like protein [Mya arenaria]|uniref:FAT4-like protein n=1 Tax=Mya arenaria TaxID=6604 RepID=A0ABY7EFH0_MYAAR|nr:FAT4-like protein [Mya arenaria]
MKKLFLALLTISLVQWGESIDANACQSSPCVHGSCFSGPAGYLCVCDHGYTGIHCDSSIAMWCKIGDWKERDTNVHDIPPDTDWFSTVRTMLLGGDMQHEHVWPSSKHFG